MEEEANQNYITHPNTPLEKESRQEEIRKQQDFKQTPKKEVYEEGAS